MPPIQIEGIEKDFCIAHRTTAGMQVGKVESMESTEQGLLFNTTTPTGQVYFDRELVAVADEERSFGIERGVNFIEKFRSSDYVSYMEVKVKNSGGIEVEGT